MVSENANDCNFISLFRSLVFLLDVYKAELFCSRKPPFIDLKIRCGLHHIGVISVPSQAKNSRLELIVRVAQQNLKVSHKFHTSLTD